MRHIFAVMVALALVSPAVAQETQAAGTQPGQTLPGPFRAYVVTGQANPTPPDGVQPEERQNLGDVARVGKFHDFVTRYGLDPTVAVFSHAPPTGPDQPLAKLFQALDQSVDKHRSARLHAFGIFLTLKGDYLTDESWAALIKQIEGFARQLQLKNIPLALDKAESERTKAYNIPADATVVVLLYVDQKVTARHAFTADRPLDDAGVQAILADVRKLVEPKK